MSEFVVDEKWLLLNGLYCCPYCKKEYSKRGIVTHIWRAHGGGKDHDPNIGFKGQRAAWNKGLTKESDTRVLQQAEHTSKTLQHQIKTGVFKPRRMGIEKRQLLSQKQSLHNSGGKCKWFDVANQKVQGTWERNLALLFENLKIDWKKLKINSDIVTYTLNGTIRRYTPDFYLTEIDRYIEVKGFWWGNDLEKMRLVCEQNPQFSLKCIIVQQVLYEQLLQCETKEECLKMLTVI